MFFAHFEKLRKWNRLTNARRQTFQEQSSSESTPESSPQRHHKPLLVTPNHLRDLSSFNNWESKSDS